MPAMDLSAWRLLESSDAHYLENILEPVFYLETLERSVDAIFDAIAGILP
jgi:hypothetical protein